MTAATTISMSTASTIAVVGTCVLVLIATWEPRRRDAGGTERARSTPAPERAETRRTRARPPT